MKEEIFPCSQSDCIREIYYFLFMKAIDGILALYFEFDLSEILQP